MTAVNQNELALEILRAELGGLDIQWCATTSTQLVGPDLDLVVSPLS